MAGRVAVVPEVPVVDNESDGGLAALMTRAYPKSMREWLRSNIMAGIPFFMWGNYGIGKSDIAKSLATELGYAFADIRLSQFEQADLKGMPHQTELLGIKGVEFAPPFILPRDLDVDTILTIEHETWMDVSFSRLNPQGKNGLYYVQKPEFCVTVIGANSAEARVISSTFTSVRIGLYRIEDGVPTEFFTTGRVRLAITGKAKVLIAYEEMNSAEPSVLAACYQLLLDRACGEYIIPELCYQMGMGNRAQDHGVTYTLPEPLSNRMAHGELVVSVEEWIEHAITHEFHPATIAFIQGNRSLLTESDDAGKIRARTAVPRPRTWEMASRWLVANPDAGRSLIKRQITGTVGMMAGYRFLAFFEMTRTTPNPMDILSGKIVRVEIAANDEKVGLEFGIIHSLANALQESMQRFQEINPAWLAKDPNDKNFRSKERKLYNQMCDHALEFILNTMLPEVWSFAITLFMQKYKLKIDPQSAVLAALIEKSKHHITAAHSGNTHIP